MNSHLVNVQQVWLDKQQLSKTKIVDKVFDLNELEEGEVLLKIEAFGFSANNITYGVLGDKMGYWGFFPASIGFGILPVWGFATVVLSRIKGIESGERIFGYLPMASHWVIRPSKISAQGFFDAQPNRKSISAVYDNYLRCEQDPGYDFAKEAIQMNIRPLFMTSFVLDDYVGEQLNTDIECIVVTSASSKTAYGTAHLLQKHRVGRGAHYRVVGLTSAANVAFCQQLACYDEVLCYDEHSLLNLQQDCLVLDFSGNKPLLLALQQKFAAKIQKLLFIGATDVDAQSNKPQGELQGELFFAPAQVKKRMHDWGPQDFAQRYAQAWSSFSSLIEANTRQVNIKGAEAIAAIYTQALSAPLNNNHINVLRF